MTSAATYADGAAVPAARLSGKSVDSKRRSVASGHPHIAASSPLKSGESAGGSPLRLTRRGRIVIVVAVLGVVLGLMTFVGSPAASTAAPHHAKEATVVVEPGQTLWDIAAATAPGSDPRVVVAEIVQLNDLADPGGIRAGQPLSVPAQ